MLQLCWWPLWCIKYIFIILSLSRENMLNSLSRRGHSIFRIHTTNRWIFRNRRIFHYSSGGQGPNNGANKYLYHSATFLITTALSSATITLCDDDKDSNDFFSKIKATLDKNKDLTKSLDGLARDVGSKVRTVIVD